MIFILTVLLSFVTVAAGFIVYHFSKTHKTAKQHSTSLRIAGFILIAAGLVSIALNLGIYEKYRKEGKVEQLLPFEIAKPE